MSDDENTAVETEASAPDDDDYIDCPALARTHPYGTRSA